MRGVASLRSLRRLLRLRRREQIIARVLIVLACLLGGAGLVLYALSGTRPSWWKDGFAPPTPELERAATLLENAIVSELSRPRALATQTSPAANIPPSPASAPWAVLVRSADVNAWLNTKLPRWLGEVAAEGQADRPKLAAHLASPPTPPPPSGWLGQVRELQVEFDDSGVQVGASVGPKGREQWLSATLEPSVRDGQLWLEATSARLGRVPVPVSLVFSQRDSGAGFMTPAARLPVELRTRSETRQILRGLAGSDPIVRNPSARLQDGRRVRVLGVMTQPGAIIITCQTESAR